MPGGEFRMSDGDWTCPDTECGNVNFARRFQCNRCGKEKKIEKLKKQGAEIGSAAAEKSKGLFSAEDWQCAKCGNVNWARRSTCNVCNAQKFTEVEERTGLGGGFNERGVVEYKQRQDSDDEFDDFGRRKKKYRKELQTPAGPKYKAEQEEEEEDEDEDEDDDDDDDLSKYDLWGNEEAGTKEETQPSKPKSNSPKRSRSKSRSRNRNKRSRSSSSSSSDSSRSRSRGRRSRDRRGSKRSRSRQRGRKSGRRYSSSSSSSSRRGSRSRSGGRRGKRSQRSRASSSSSSPSSRSRSRRSNNGRRDRSRERRH